MTDRFVLDPQRSRVRVRTFAKGLFAVLAHDLELDAAPTGAVVHDGGVSTATIEIRADAIHVVGVVRRGRVHTDVLSAKDVQEIERKLRDEVFAPSTALSIVATGTREAPQVSFEMPPPGRGTTPGARVVEVRAGEVLEVRAKGTVSMRALGLPVVRAPLNAFVVEDELAIDAVLVFA
ncbi:MAG: hypothetical protein NVSMB47_01770 [Polyangiales bacterium]